MKSIIRPACFFSFLVPALLLAQPVGTIFSFYRVADSVAAHPLLHQKLQVICQEPLEGYHVTFLGYEGEHQAFIAAVTQEPIANPNADIERSVEFREIKPVVGKVSTWGYIFDRNGDGKIDYLELLEGAGAVEPANFPKDFPVRGKQLNARQQEYFINHCSLIFSHWADDSYGGNISAAVLPDLDAGRDWIQRRLLIRGTTENGKLDDVRTFRYQLTERLQKVAHTDTSVAYRSMTNAVEQFTQRSFAVKNAILRMINSAAQACGLGSGSFPRK